MGLFSNRHGTETERRCVCGWSSKKEGRGAWAQVDTDLANHLRKAR